MNYIELQFQKIYYMLAPLHTHYMILHHIPWIYIHYMLILRTRRFQYPTPWRLATWTTWTPLYTESKNLCNSCVTLCNRRQPFLQVWWTHMHCRNVKLCDAGAYWLEFYFQKQTLIIPFLQECHRERICPSRTYVHFTFCWIEVWNIDHRNCRRQTRTSWPNNYWYITV